MKKNGIAMNYDSFAIALCKHDFPAVLFIIESIVLNLNPNIAPEYFSDNCTA
ncbi:hypothetical protein IMCC9480_3123 [Oxalobacteraceae bacterium IMCC9480]|nr:hypothetical protein IMCC9480_3123 [Oxalobacteraceae bacterium IMCC9480]